MERFWQFRNLSQDEGELTLYGNISSSKPWWDDSGEGIYSRQFADDLKSLGSVRNLTVRLNSNGGDVFAANAIYTQLKNHDAAVTIIIDGVAASAATIIAMAGDIVKAPSNAIFMIHDPLVQLWGNYNIEDMDKMKSTLETVKESIMNAYMSKTNFDRTRLSEMMKKETWMTAEDAKLEGFIDEIMFEESIDATVTNDGRFMVVNSVCHNMTGFSTRPSISDKKKAIIENKVISPVITPINQKVEGEVELEIKNLEELKQKFPSLYDQLVNQAQTDERNRLKSIDEISATVDAALVAKAKYDEPMTAQALAFEALKADASKGKEFQNKREQELEPAAHVPGSTTQIDKAGEIGDDVLNKIANAANQKRAKEVTK